MLVRAAGLFLGVALAVLTSKAVVRGAHHAAYGGGSVDRSDAKGLLLQRRSQCCMLGRAVCLLVGAALAVLLFKKAVVCGAQHAG